MSDQKHSLRILIVDDCPEDRETCRRLLKRYTGVTYEVHWAGTGAEGIDLFRRLDPSCVLLDYRLPDLDGLEVVRQMATCRDDGILPVIMLTEAGDEELAVKAMKLGCQDYLSKSSMTSSSLNRAITNAISKVSLQKKIVEQHQKLKRLARYDDLTGLLNRRSLFEELRKEYQRCLRRQQNLTALMIDIDHFKDVNDSYGHFIGDVVLRATGQLIGQMIREIDLGGRLGGEEFIVILTDTDDQGGYRIAERIRRRLSRQKHLTDDGWELQVTCSIGIASLGGNEVDTDELLKRADQAMYAAKDAGRDQSVIWSVAAVGAGHGHEVGV